jgi:hypothetical protein
LQNVLTHDASADLVDAKRSESKALTGLAQIFLPLLTASH